MTHKHECLYLRNDQHRYQKIELGNDQWLFEYKFFEPLEVIINFCHFCGEKLNPDCETISTKYHKQNIPAARHRPETFYQCPELKDYNASKHGEIWLISKPFWSSFELRQYWFEDKELVFQFGFSITYCPFCGEPLNMRDVYNLPPRIG